MKRYVLPIQFFYLLCYSRQMTWDCSYVCDPSSCIGLLNSRPTPSSLGKPPYTLFSPRDSKEVTSILFKLLFPESLLLALLQQKRRETLWIRTLTSEVGNQQQRQFFALVHSFRLKISHKPPDIWKAKLEDNSGHVPFLHNIWGRPNKGCVTTLSGVKLFWTRVPHHSALRQLKQWILGNWSLLLGE